MTLGDILAQLHIETAQVMLEVLRNTESFMDEGGVETKTRTVSAAELSVICRFLKDNHTTIEIKQDNDLGKIQNILDNKSKHGRTTLAAIDPTALAEN